MSQELGRRRFLGLAGGLGLLAVTGGVSACVASADGGGLSGPGRKLVSKRPLPRQFATPLPIPPVARPVRTENGVDHYELVEREGRARILPDARTTVWGFDGRFPGPTFDVPARKPIVVTVRNELPVPTSTHLHGGVTEPDSDGYATDLVVPRGFDTRSRRSITGRPA